MALIKFFFINKGPAKYLPKILHTLRAALLTFAVITFRYTHVCTLISKNLKLSIHASVHSILFLTNSYSCFKFHFGLLLVYEDPMVFSPRPHQGVSSVLHSTLSLPLLWYSLHCVNIVCLCLPSLHD